MLVQPQLRPEWDKPTPPGCGKRVGAPPVVQTFPSMKTLAAILLLSNACCGQSFTGYTEQGTATQRQIEAKFKSLPSPEEARKHHRFLTSEPHPAGSERNNELARHIAEAWKAQGLEDVRIHRYDVLNTAPRDVQVEMVAPKRYVASLREDAYKEDPDTANPRISRGWTGMSASGEVTAPLVYAHSGNPEDYDLLAKHGIDVRGKVVIVRYSNPYSYRGFKALTAQQRGAAALLIYSDPAEDGFKRGKVYPEGPWGPESHIQRGAITYDFIVPGDPLTPGWASLEGAKRIRPEEAQSVPKIMAVPMSWRDAKPLLENLDGPAAPKEWQGGLPIKYRLGGKRVKVHVKVDMDNSIKPNLVVEARIRGAELPDEWVLLGNHRDAWEFGGVDPSSGTASMLEVTRALGEMLKQGLRPRRTLVFASWDGEEVGLTGSTEWGEHFADELKQKLVAYINVDSSTSGPDFNATSVGSLAPLIVEVSREVNDPSGKPLYDVWKATVEKSRQPAAKEEAKGGWSVGSSGEGLVDTRIGSGSDHTVFLNLLGRPTILLGFDGPYGVYHSAYDNFYWMNRFGDPGYRYHTLMAQLWGVLGLRLANAELLPFDFEYYGRDIRRFLEEIGAKPGAKEDWDAAAILRSADDFASAGKELNTQIRQALASGELEPAAAARLNRALLDVESNWLNPEGIPGRPWFKHMLYAARYTYAHLELPGITEAVEKKDWKTAAEQTRLLEAAIRKNTELLRSARAALQP